MKTKVLIGAACLLLLTGCGAPAGNSPAQRAAEAAGDPSSAAESTAGVTPELKEFLDGYEAFMDEYINFMKKYQDASDPLSLMTDYLSIMQEYADMVQALEDWDTDEMSKEDLAYYLEVTGRVSQKMLKAVG